RQFALAQTAEQGPQALWGLPVDCTLGRDPFAAAVPAGVGLALGQIKHHRILDNCRRRVGLRFRRGRGGAAPLGSRDSAVRNARGKQNERSQQAVTRSGKGSGLPGNAGPRHTLADEALPDRAAETHPPFTPSPACRLRLRTVYRVASSTAML